MNKSTLTLYRAKEVIRMFIASPVKYPFFFRASQARRSRLLEIDLDRRVAGLAIFDGVLLDPDIDRCE